MRGTIQPCPVHLTILMRYVTVEPRVSLVDLNKAISRGIPEREHKRSSGTHLTDILQRANKEAGRIKDRIVFGRYTFDPLDEDDMPMCMALGMAFETMLVQLYPWISRIGELSKDGIAMSPDGGSLNCHRHMLAPNEKIPVVLEEIKLTWKTSSKILEEHLSYLQQSKAYCHALDTEYSRLHVCHVNGNYKFGDDPGGGPHYFQHHIRYTPFELTSNWAEILRKKREYGL